MLLDDDFETLLVWPIESGQQQVQVHGQTVQNGDIVLLGAHQFGHWLLRRKVGQCGGHVAVEVRMDASVRPTVQHLFDVLIERLWLETQRLTAQVDAVLFGALHKAGVD